MEWTSAATLTLINVVVNGNGTDGSGVNISGNLTSSGNSTVTGNASGLTAAV
ncbi:hypothetical protein O5169_22150 [Escherichia coli]|nr:hypothetical protein [Escherichia coli]